MSDMNVFVIDDDFDPLAELSIDEEDVAQETDYLPPIPDADKSVVPKAVELTAQERIENLLAGLPGQRFRLLRAVELCEQPQEMSQVVDQLDADCPQRASVFDAAQVIRLLEREGALERVEDKASAPCDQASAESSAEYLVVTPAAPVRYVATQAGLEAVRNHVGERVVLDMLNEEPRYLPLYRTIFQMCLELDGGNTAALNAAIDVDPLCEEPRRFCTYFLGRLESAGALVWRDAWIVTDAGSKAYASGIFND